MHRHVNKGGSGGLRPFLTQVKYTYCLMLTGFTETDKGFPAQHSVDLEQLNTCTQYANLQTRLLLHCYMPLKQIFFLVEFVHSCHLRKV